MPGKKESSGFLRKSAKVVFVLAASVVLVLAGARLYFRIPVNSYYRASEKAFAIPGLSDNLIPQGFDYIESEGIYLVGGYQKDNSPSRIYLIEKESGRTKGYVVLGDQNGNGMAIHAGGLAYHGKYLYVGGNEDPLVYVFNLSDVLSGGNGEIVKTLGTFEARYGDYEIRADFMCFYDGKFFVGEYYRDPNFPTPESHSYTGPSGETTRALMFSFNVSDQETSRFGIDPVAAEVYTLPGLAQGVTIYDNRIWITRSYAATFSTVRSYDVFGKPAGVFDPAAGDAKVYVLDKSSMVSEIKAPPMAEELIFVNGKMLIMSESASNKYIFGKFTGGRWCYATDVKKNP